MEIINTFCMFICPVDCDMSELGVHNTEMAALPE
jgi:hypothetical protein